MISPPRAGLGALVCLFAACHGDSSTPATASALVVSAGMESVAPAADAPLPSGPRMQRVGLSAVDRQYRVTTPADTPFSFDLMSRAPGNTGTVNVSVAHVADGDQTPIGDAMTLAEAGCVPVATGIFAFGRWFGASGEGFARITLAGTIQRDQVVAVETMSPAGRATALVHIELGPESSINRVAGFAGNHPGVVAQATLYSSDSWVFGLPTAAVSGDRTSIVVYEGDRGDLRNPDRYELRLQHDRKTGEVTGGAGKETNRDSGNWRDHEVAALFNVLALARCGNEAVKVQLSFDRGATFAQEVVVPSVTHASRLVQIAMAADYSLAVAYWTRTGSGPGIELRLLEGRPSAFDANGSPTAYAFAPPAVLHSTPRDAVPMLTGAQWSTGGDLVVGYAFSDWRPAPRSFGEAVTEFWCAVRPWAGEFATRNVDEARIAGRDPSVALLDSGEDLKILYAYEGRAGVLLTVSVDAGLTWSEPAVVGTRGAHTPSVFARRKAGAVEVDVLFLADAGAGTELHAARWSDFGVSGREDFQLTRMALQKVTGGPNSSIGYGLRLTQVSWFGYDAVLDGDEIVVVFDEETVDARFVFATAPGQSGTLSGGFRLPPQFSASRPPPLAPGLTEKMPAPDATHRHQLRLLRLR